MSQPPAEPPREPVFPGMDEDPDTLMNPDRAELDSAERVSSNLPTDNILFSSTVPVLY